MDLVVRPLAIVACACLVTFIGCTESTGPKFKLTPVTGSVKMNGAPLADADVQFFPDGPAPEGYMGSAAKTDANGNYELYTGDQKGAIEGRFKVTVSKLTDPQGNPIKDDPTAGIDREQIIQSGGAVESIPPQYSDRMQTTLSTEVAATPGKAHEFHIEIKK